LETTENTSQERPDADSQAGTQTLTPPAPNAAGPPIWVEPDLEFIRALGRHGADSLKQCFQCGTCSGTCTITPDEMAMPSKEIAWAAWGMKDRLLRDPDIWLCYQCNDCSSRCPRGVRPGDVLGAIRQEVVTHYAFPRFLGRWINEPQSILVILSIPMVLLTLALYLRGPIEEALGLGPKLEGRIVYAYSSIFPHWLLNSFFGFFALLALIAMIISVRRFWKGIHSFAEEEGRAAPVKPLGASIGSVLKSVFRHDKFSLCENAHIRFWSHACVFFGFLALTAVTLWVITLQINPLARGDFLYPFGFWNPWKLLANAGGLSLLVGLFLIMKYRLLKDPGLAGRRLAGAGSYFDWMLISTLLLVVFTGFFTEALHFIRLEPHRHVVYFFHLVFVFVLLIYLPYSKFAHIVYRTVAQVFAEHTGREFGVPRSPNPGGKKK
jgi:quinone-modifying oxidoreductase subunit QmoC